MGLSLRSPMLFYVAIIGTVLGASSPSFSVTLNTQQLLDTFGECRVEYALSPQWSLSGIGGFGRETSEYQFDVGAQQRYYIFGDFTGGFSIGGQFVYLHILHKDQHDHVTAHLFYPSVFSGAKYVFDIGFTLDALLGMTYTTAVINNQRQSSVITTGEWDPLIAFNLGWSF